MTGDGATFYILVGIFSLIISIFYFLLLTLEKEPHLLESSEKLDILLYTLDRRIVQLHLRVSRNPGITLR